MKNEKQEFKVGDEVITAKFEVGYFENTKHPKFFLVEGQLNFIGKPGLITQLNRTHIGHAMVHGFWWPFIALEHVNHLQIPNVSINNKGVLKTIEMEKPTSLKTKEELIKNFNNYSHEGKTLLKELFGKEMFEQSITDKVKTFDDAFKIYCDGYEIQPIYPKYTDNTKQGAFERLLIIADVLNEGIITPGEKEYFGVYWSFDENAFQACTSQLTNVYCVLFKTRELAEHTIKYFPDLFKTLLT